MLYQTLKMVQKIYIFNFSFFLNLQDGTIDVESGIQGLDVECGIYVSFVEVMLTSGGYFIHQSKEEKDIDTSFEGTNCESIILETFRR